MSDSFRILNLEAEVERLEEKCERLEQENDTLREALKDSLIWYNQELTNSTELDAEYRRLRDIACPEENIKHPEKSKGAP